MCSVWETVIIRATKDILLSSVVEEGDIPLAVVLDCILVIVSLVDCMVFIVLLGVFLKRPRNMNIEFLPIKNHGI